MIGYSGSGKTVFIMNAIKLLKKKLNYNVAVIKNIHEHQIDKEDKDTFKYGEAGAVFSITQNINNETTIFLKKEIELEKLLNWIVNCPYKINLIFIEGFRNLKYPTILCLKEWNNLKPQLTDNIKVISGIVCSKNHKKSKTINLDIPVIDIKENFNEFIEIFNLD